MIKFCVRHLFLFLLRFIVLRICFAFLCTNVIAPHLCHHMAADAWEGGHWNAWGAGYTHHEGGRGGVHKRVAKIVDQLFAEGEFELEQFILHWSEVPYSPPVDKEWAYKFDAATDSSEREALLYAKGAKDYLLWNRKVNTLVTMRIQQFEIYKAGLASAADEVAVGVA